MIATIRKMNRHLNATQLKQHADRAMDVVRALEEANRWKEAQIWRRVAATYLIRPKRKGRHE
jgi:hypothetical protein